LNILSKTKITVSNYLGGKCFFTVDEVILNKNIVRLVKSKSVLRLTFEVFLGVVSSKFAQKDIESYFKVNSLSKKQKNF
jgi:hypothetical protein